MKTHHLFVISAMAFCSLFSACNTAPKDDPSAVPQLNENNIEAVIAAMTSEEKIDLVVGAAAASMLNFNAPTVGTTQELVPGAAGTTVPIPRLGIPAIVLADGPAGLRISPTRQGTSETFYCTAFPIATLLASSWNTDLVQQVGTAMGNEVLEYGADVLLGPGMNIHRNPLCGRNFEYYSEDPLLTGKMAAAMINGVQSNGVGTSAKHFAMNSQETHRMGNDAQADTRTIREIYLKGFEIAVKEAQPWTLMSSYNQINGVYAAENKDLLTTITRDEWGFEGMVMTDWYGGTNAARQVSAGNDLQMPGRPDQIKGLTDALADGTLSEADLNTSVRRILQLIVKTPRFKGYAYSNKPDLKAHAQVTRNSAAEGMILLKNEGNTLPLAKNVRQIALFGNTSYKFIAGGTGSGDVNEAYTIALREGLANAGYATEPLIDQAYEAYMKAETDKQNAALQEAMKVNPLAAFLGSKPIDEFQPDQALMTKSIQQADIVIFTIGRNSGEFTDRLKDDDFLLKDKEKEVLNNVIAVAHQNGKKVIVVLNIGGVIETASWKEGPDAIFLAWQGGQEGGNTVADLLKGTVTPSGKLPMTFPVNLEDHASTDNFPMTQVALDLSAFMGGNGAQADAPKVKDVDYTQYKEGIFVGYRHFDSNKIGVSYPFGYGLSYTQFDYANIAIKRKGTTYTVTCDITNKGSNPGKEAVQLYVAAPASKLVKPAKELRAFAKTDLLQPGQTQHMTFTFTAQDLASFDKDASAWITEKATTYKAMVGASSQDIRLELPFEVKKAIVREAHNVMLPQ